MNQKDIEEDKVTRDKKAITDIEVRGAKVHNLKDLNVDIPLGKIVAIAGVSGSGKSSLALGVLYAEGSRRYLEGLSTYMRRRITQAPQADVDSLKYVPAAIALHQRPGVPGVRSTFGTGTELLNNLRLLFSRCASHKCPKCGTYHEPSLAVAEEQELVCHHCGNHWYGPSAEDLSFNSTGACPVCGGTGVAYTPNPDSYISDPNKSIEDGAIAPWNQLMWKVMIPIVRDMGVRINVPFKDLTEKEKDILFNSPMEKHKVFYVPKNGGKPYNLNFTYYSPKNSILNALANVKNDAGMKRLQKFVHMGVCPACNGTRLNEAARAPRIEGIGIDKATEMILTDNKAWINSVPASLPPDMQKMSQSIVDSYNVTAKRLIDLGLDYLSFDRPASSLSNGERQRMALARTVRNSTTGVLYVLDEPSIGLHPVNIIGLEGVIDDLINDGNSVVLVDHNLQLLKSADWLIEIGPGAGKNGGELLTEGTVEQTEENPKSKIGPFLAEKAPERTLPVVPKDKMFDLGTIKMSSGSIYTVKPLKLSIPKGRLVTITGVSGSGKSTAILRSLVPGLLASINKEKMPDHVKSVEAAEIKNVKVIDSTPIGANINSTVATYANIHDQLRTIFAKTKDAKKLKLKAGDFSYNTGKLQCPVCKGNGVITLDVQFLPDVDITCPECHGSRYAKSAYNILVYNEKGDSFSLPELMGKDVSEAIDLCEDQTGIRNSLETLDKLGLGYLTLGEATPSLSGGEAQRLKLASEMGKVQSDSLFVFDEPTIGLHPLDVRTLLHVFQNLIREGATLVVITHDLGVIRNADWVIDMGPGGGSKGGEIVASGTPEEIAANPNSVTGRFLNID